MKSAPPASGTRAAPRDVLRVVLVYAAFAGLWILVSDNLVLARFGGTDHVLIVSLLKGWLFVTVTGSLLFVLIRRLLDQALAASHRELAAQQDAARAQHLLYTISDNSSDAIFAKDLQGRYLLFNRETARIIDKTADEALGHDDAVLFPPQQAAMIRANDLRVIAEQRINTYEEALTTVDGERIYLATKGPLRDADGRIIGMFGISRDITERQRAERELRRSMEELERFNRVAVDRELDMIGLKRRVNELSRQLGEAPPHALDFVDTAAGEPAPASATVGAPL